MSNGDYSSENGAGQAPDGAGIDMDTRVRLRSRNWSDAKIDRSTQQEIEAELAKPPNWQAAGTAREDQSTNGDGGDGEQERSDGGVFNFRIARWSLPPALMWLVQLQGEASQELFNKLIEEALRVSVDEDNIIKACLDGEPPYGGCVYKHVCASGGEDYVKQTIARVANAPLSAGDHEREEIHVVRAGAGTDILWRATERALKKRKCPVFVRNDRLVQPLWHWEKAANRNVLVAKLERFSLLQLIDMVGHNAVQFKKLVRGNWIEIDPPEEVIEQLLAAHHYILPQIAGIVTSPTMRNDAALSLITEPGYDEPTQLWYKSSDNVQVPPVPERPTRDEAVTALKLLNSLLDGFPFEGETKDKRKSVSRSAALAGMMTTVAIGALEAAAVPLFLVTANDARTGKTYLINLIGVIATGHVPVPNSGARKQEEFEKRVETAALTGRPFMHFNNLPNGMVVESERLAELSSERKVFIRKLGRHEEGECNCRATVAFLNGNNILPSGDLVPRTVSCRLDAQMQHPEERKFAAPYPHERVRADRGAYLAAVFTIMRAYRAAGEPEQKCKCVAGYEQWSRLVQQALIWLGEEDPWGTMEDMRAIDPAEENLKRLLKALADCRFVDDQFTVADCKKKADDFSGDGYHQARKFTHDVLRELMSERGQINTKSFGWLLRNSRDKIRDGCCIRLSTRGKTRIFYLEGADKLRTATASTPGADAPAAGAGADEDEPF